MFVCFVQGFGSVLQHFRDQHTRDNLLQITGDRVFLWFILEGNCNCIEDHEPSSSFDHGMYVQGIFFLDLGFFHSLMHCTGLCSH
jgi:hypothetical protein